MRLVFTVLLVTILIDPVWAADELPKAPEMDCKGWNLYEVVRIVDGDTIKVDFEGEELSVRIIGVDTPETKHPTKPVEFFGKEASAFTTALLNDTWVYLEPDQGEKLSMDRYDRLLAHVWREDGLLVALEIIRQGYGFAYVKYPFREDYMDIYTAYEQDARENERGLWLEPGD